jgi:lipopolysaccharide/colanic/teichoic acid biosynthesis glycosyltransferase
LTDIAARIHFIVSVAGQVVALADDETSCLLITTRRGRRISMWYSRFVKRTIDILVSSIMLVLAMPLTVASI